MSDDATEPTRDDFRAVGFTEEAAALPKDELGLLMIAAFNNVTVEQLPLGARYDPNESMRKAWGRVAEAARIYFTKTEGK